MALAFVALLGDQELRLRLGLDALGDDAQAEGEAERDGRAAHGARFVIVADFLDERAVDHDAVERAGAQSSERDVAGTEVVDEHAHALAAQLMQGREAGAAGGEHLFGDLEIEARRLDAGFARGIGDVFGETLGGQILAADVDRDAQTAAAAFGERREIAAGAPQHPASELHRQAREFRDGQEFRSGHEAADLVRPAQESLDRDDLARREQVARLVVQLELVVLDRLGELLLPVESRERGQAQRVGVEE